MENFPGARSYLALTPRALREKWLTQSITLAIGGLIVSRSLNALLYIRTDRCPILVASGCFKETSNSVVHVHVSTIQIMYSCIHKTANEGAINDSSLTTFQNVTQLPSNTFIVKLVFSQRIAHPIDQLCRLVYFM